MSPAAARQQRSGAQTSVWCILRVAVQFKDEEECAPSSF